MSPKERLKYTYELITSEQATQIRHRIAVMTAIVGLIFSTLGPKYPDTCATDLLKHTSASNICISEILQAVRKINNQPFNKNLFKTG